MTLAPTPPDAARAQAEALRAEIRAANHAYYNLGRPSLTDDEYDGLLQQLQALEAAHPTLATPDSPTRSVGHRVAPETTGLSKRRHTTPMLSLANAFSHDALELWAAKQAPHLGRSALGPLHGELKIDGLSCELVYERGRLVGAATRGDGEVGEDVTANVKTIAGVPHALTLAPGEELPARVAVRGEIFLPRSGFATTNRRLEHAGIDPYITCRNAASGILRRQDPTETAAFPLAFFAYAIALPDDAPVSTARPHGLDLHTQDALILQLAAWGFPTCPERAVCTSLAEVAVFVDGIAARREALDYDIDGVVLKVNSLDDQAALGSANRDPRWAIARKWPAEEVETTIHGIDVTVGRTGMTSPVAVLAPVVVGGVTVTSATLHNKQYIIARDIRLGDRVVVTRAGEVIPKVLRVNVEARTGAERAWDYPTTCPSCRATLQQPEGKADIYCTNVLCDAQQLRRIIYWASRPAMDIRGLGPEVAKSLMDAGLVRTVADLYRLTEAPLLALDGFAATKATNLLGAIDASRAQPLARCLIGLGIPDVGEVLARTLAQTFLTIDGLLAADLEALGAVRGLGPERAPQIAAFLGDAHVRRLIADLRAAGVHFPAAAAAAAGGTFAGMTIVCTGALSRERGAIEAMIRAAGGKTAGSVSRKTTAVVAGDAAGSKLEKARELGVPVWTEADLLARLGTGAA